MAATGDEHVLSKAVREARAFRGEEGRGVGGGEGRRRGEGGGGGGRPCERRGESGMEKRGGGGGVSGCKGRGGGEGDKAGIVWCEAVQIWCAEGRSIG